MSFIRTIGKQVALRVSSLVAKNELFERMGDRPVQPPLEPDAWTLGKASLSAGPQDKDDGGSPVNAQLMTAAPIKKALSKGPMVVNHWATWCESCQAETSALKLLAARTSVPLVGVSWDVFEGGTPEAALEAVKSFAASEGKHWDQLVVKGGPAHFFKSLGIDFQQIPQTWLIDSEGVIVSRIEGPIAPADLDALIEKVNAL